MSVGWPRPLQSQAVSGLSALEGATCCRHCLFPERLAHFAALESGREYEVGFLCFYNVEKTQILEGTEMCLLELELKFSSYVSLPQGFVM